MFRFALISFFSIACGSQKFCRGDNVQWLVQDKVCLLDHSTNQTPININDYQSIINEADLAFRSHYPAWSGCHYKAKHGFGLNCGNPCCHRDRS